MYLDEYDWPTTANKLLLRPQNWFCLNFLHNNCQPINVNSTTIIYLFVCICACKLTFNWYIKPLTFHVHITIMRSILICFQNDFYVYSFLQYCRAGCINYIFWGDWLSTYISVLLASKLEECFQTFLNYLFVW